jgi:hypothetical protein
MNVTQQHKELSPDMVLSKALLNVGKALNLTQVELASIVGKDRSTLKKGIKPDSVPGQLASLVIRLYRALYVLVGGKKIDMLHWLQTENVHTRGVPVDQIQTVTGLNDVVNYLDAMRGKT